MYVVYMWNTEEVDYVEEIISVVYGKLYILIVLYVLWYYYFVYVSFNRFLFLLRIVLYLDIYFKNFILVCIFGLKICFLKVNIFCYVMDIEKWWFFFY